MVDRDALQELASRRPRISLKARALRYLAQREHSRFELRRKLQPHAGETDDLEGLLDQLERDHLLSQQRFVDSLVQRRGRQYGARRIELELQQHQIDPETMRGAVQSLRANELEHARAAWTKRFGRSAADPRLLADPRERARQQRFLSQRGFSGETISRLFRQLGEGD